MLAGGEDSEPAREPNKRQLKRQKREKEEAVRAAEMARLEGKAPETATDYERELLGAPNSSLLWIRYMAFLIGLGELPQARAVAERALQTIHFRRGISQAQRRPKLLGLYTTLPNLS